MLSRARKRQPVVDPLQRLAELPISALRRCHVFTPLSEVTTVADDEDIDASDVSAAAVESVWRAIEAMYRTGVYPALQVCIRRQGHVVLHRAIGHGIGNSPGQYPNPQAVPATTETPFVLSSATKAITAMVIHKLDEDGLIHLEDRVCDYIPEFGRHGKRRITIRHLLSHRAGIPNLPPEYVNLDLLTEPERILEVLCNARLRSRPGRLLAYHAITGGFVLGEVVKRAAGEDISRVLEKRILEPLGLRWLRYGVKPDELPLVAIDAPTGPPVPPPMSTVLRNAFGVEFDTAVALCNDPRFLTAVVPSANGISNASDAAAFYQCLLNGGELDGVRVFKASTVRHATTEQSYWELDRTLGMPLRYSLGFMMGSKRASLFGLNNPAAFGHVGFTNTFTWADPERQLAVAILTNGKPGLSMHGVRLLQLAFSMDRAFPKIPSPPARSY